MKSAMHASMRAVLVMAALAMAALAGCTSLGFPGATPQALRNPPLLHDPESKDARAQDAAKEQIASYYDAMSRANPKVSGDGVVTENAAAVARYLDVGIGLVDSYCKRWFYGLEQFERKSEANKKDFNVVSQLGTALIGIAKLHPDVTAVYGASTTAYNGWSANLTDGLLIAPSSKGVKAKVIGALQERAAVIRAMEPPPNFVAARSALESYADICTYTGAKELVDKSVDSAKVEVQASGAVKAVATSGTFGADRSSAILQKLWSPDGKTYDASFEKSLKAWMAANGFGSISVNSLLYRAAFADARARALQEIELK